MSLGCGRFAGGRWSGWGCQALLRAVLCAGWLALPSAGMAQPVDASGTDRAGGRHASMSVWLTRGEDQPVQVLAELGEDLLPAEEGSARRMGRRALWRTRGLVAAGAGLETEWRAALKVLQTLQNEALVGSSGSAPSIGSIQLGGDVALLQAHWLDQQGQVDAAAEQARLADQAYSQACSLQEGPQSADCDLPSAWRALRLRWRRAEGQGAWVEAVPLAQRGLTLAERADDPGLVARTWSILAVYGEASGDRAAAQRSIDNAERAASQAGDNRIWVSVRYNQARLAQQRGQDPQALQFMQQALQQARQARSPRLTAWVQLGLGDLLRRDRRSPEALQVLDQALAVIHRFREQRLIPMALHNRGLARILVGQMAAGRADLEAALAIWQATGTRLAMEVAMREASDTLAQVGDVRGALELYHREQALRAEINRANREAALAQMRDRYRAESERRELELLERENELRTSRLNNQSLLERVWLLAVILLALGSAVMALLLLRARDSNRQLRRNEALLRLQSERDPLTGLANRRHFREALQHRGSGPAFAGALLLLDIDHFKRINDQQGHACGDLVLSEVARRLEASVRENDLVCRWGGEEFLVFAPDLQGDGLHTLARRMLHAVGDVPVACADAQRLPVTVSVGYASFPLPEHSVALGWEHAVNLVDMALYTAKAMGRDRAVGLVSLAARDADQVREIEQDFELARLTGDVVLQVQVRTPQAGPGPG